MKTHLYLTDEILNYPAQLGSLIGLSENEWRHSYEILKHAEEILNKAIDNFYLIDSISTLKRTLNHRLNHLNKIYKFKKIPILEKPKGLLKQLEYFDIIRPIMLQKIVEIRNSLEHENATPPDKDRCYEFLEFVWYFLRSTDRLSAQMVSSFNFDQNLGQNYSLNVNLALTISSGWIFKFWGWVKPDLLSDTKRENWGQIAIEKLFTRGEGKRLRPDLKWEIDDFRGDNEDDIHFEGIILGPAKFIKRLFMLYFSIL